MLCVWGKRKKKTKIKFSINLFPIFVMIINETYNNNAYHYIISLTFFKYGFPSSSLYFYFSDTALLFLFLFNNVTILKISFSFYCISMHGKYSFSELFYYYFLFLFFSAWFFHCPCNFFKLKFSSLYHT